MSRDARREEMIERRQSQPASPDERIRRALGQAGVDRLKSMGFYNDALEALKLTSRAQAESFKQGPGFMSRVGDALTGIPSAIFSSLIPSAVAAVVVPSMGGLLRKIGLPGAGGPSFT